MRALLGGLFFRLEPARPALLDGLLAALERQRAGRHVARDDRAGSYIGALPDRDRRDQRRVGTDEGVLADVGAVLVETVVVAGDGAGADVGVFAHPRVADIGEMVGLGAGPNFRLLHLDEITDPRL